MAGESIALRLRELSDTADAPQRHSPTCLDEVPDTDGVSDSQPNRLCSPTTMDDNGHPPDERELLEEEEEEEVEESSDDDSPHLLQGRRWLGSKWCVDGRHFPVV